MVTTLFIYEVYEQKETFSLTSYYSVYIWQIDGLTNSTLLRSMQLPVDICHSGLDSNR